MCLCTLLNYILFCMNYVLLLLQQQNKIMKRKKEQQIQNSYRLQGKLIRKERYTETVNEREATRHMVGNVFLFWILIQNFFHLFFFASNLSLLKSEYVTLIQLPTILTTYSIRYGCLKMCVCVFACYVSVNMLARLCMQCTPLFGKFCFSYK